MDRCVFPPMAASMIHEKGGGGGGGGCGGGGRSFLSRQVVFFLLHDKTAGESVGHKLPTPQTASSSWVRLCRGEMGNLKVRSASCLHRILQWNDLVVHYMHIPGSEERYY